MATLYSNQFKGAYVDKPMEQIKPGDISGDVRFAFFDFDITAAPTNGDVLKLFKLPKGAKLKAFRITGPDLGSAGSLNLGWAASAEVVPGTTTPVEAANATGLISALDVNTAAFDGNMAAAAAGFLKEFNAEVDIQVAVATAWTVTTGTIKGYAEYVVI